MSLDKVQKKHEDKKNKSKKDKHDSKKAKPKRKFSKHFKNMMYLSLVIAVVIGILLSPIFSLQTITLSKTKYVDTVALEKKLSTQKGKNLLLLDKDKVLAIVKSNPYVSSATISKRPLHSLVITIKEREPVAILLTNDVSYLIDKDNRILQVKQDNDGYDLPIISGVELKNGEKLGDVIDNDGVLLALKLIIENSDELSQLIQEINVKSRHDVLLYTNQGIEVRFGDEKNATEKLRKLFDIIEQVVLPRSLNGEIEYVDMRYVSGPVIKMKAGQGVSDDDLSLTQDVPQG